MNLIPLSVRSFMLLPNETKYFLHDTELDSESPPKHLGVTVSDDLTWSYHIENVMDSRFPLNKYLGA